MYQTNKAHTLNVSSQLEIATRESNCLTEGHFYINLQLT